jgi:NADPH:quinone reductase-like Zn-dependent oxidoreductase
MFEKSASYHFIATSARARNGKLGDWALYRRWLDEWMALIASGEVRMPTVSVVGPLGEDTLAEAHERLESGGQQGKLALTVE